MANQLVPARIQIPAHLANRLSQPSSLNSSIAGGMSQGTALPRISIKAGRFRIVEDGHEMVMPSLSLSVIIVGANPHLSKTWYEATYNPDSEPAMPDCFSLDGIRPTSDSKKQQSDQCANCGQNVWGSKITPQGQKVKACADKKRLAVVSADDPGGPIYLLEVTPAALKNLNSYHKELSMRGIPAEIVVTKVGFDSNASFPKLTFEFQDFITEETQGIVDELFGSPQVIEVTGEASVQSTVVEIAKPVLVNAKKPEPVEIVVEEPTAPEPIVPKRGFGAAAKSNGTVPVTASQKRVAKEPVAAPTANVADDIANLIASLGTAKPDDEEA